MPNDIFEIGDNVMSATFGNAYIAGSPNIYGPVAQPWHRYLAYMPAKVPFLAYVINPMLQTSATPESINMIQNEVPNLVIPKANTMVYKTGDIINHAVFGRGIVLSGGHDIPKRLFAKKDVLYYHIYYTENNMFDFDDDDDITLITAATKESHHYALKLIHDNIIEPILAANTPTNPDKPVNTVLLELMNIEIPIENIT